MSKKVVVITGGTSGIGLEAAKALVAQGCKVYELSRRGEGADGRIAHIQADVTDEGQVQAAVQEIADREGRIDVLINNAGFGISGAVEFTETADAQRQFDVNFFGMVRMNKAVIPVMRRQGGGRIISMSSVAAPIAIPFQTYYSASKAGIIGMTKSLARELASKGINVNAVAPGFIETDMTKALPEAEKEKLLAVIPTGRMGKPEDIAGAVLFLAGPDSSYITGQVLTVDGGMV